MLDKFSSSVSTLKDWKDNGFKYADKNLGVIVLDRSWYTISIRMGDTNWYQLFNTYSPLDHILYDLDRVCREYNGVVYSEIEILHT